MSFRPTGPETTDYPIIPVPGPQVSWFIPLSDAHGPPRAFLFQFRRLSSLRFFDIGFQVALYSLCIARKLSVFWRICSVIHYNVTSTASRILSYSVISYENVIDTLHHDSC